MQQTRTQRPRFWLVLQPTIVRLYKIAGLIALSAILIGLISFLISSVFYFFDHSWVRPMRIDAQNEKVINANKELTSARKELGTLQADKVALEAELDGIKQAIVSQQKYVNDVGTAADAPKSPDQWMLRHSVDQTKLDIIVGTSKQPALQLKLDNMKQRIEEQDAIVKRLEQSPYLKALKEPLVLAFVPNANDAKVGTKLYACSWGLVMCSNVGTITAIYAGEVTDNHPHNSSVQRGHLVEIKVSEGAANDSVLFADSKPLWLF